MVIKVFTIHREIENKLFPLSSFLCRPSYSAASLKTAFIVTHVGGGTIFGPASSSMLSSGGTISLPSSAFPSPKKVSMLTNQ